MREARDSWYLETVRPSGYDILINGTSKYLNFNTVSGSLGYWFRDNAGTMEFKNSWGSWAPFGTGSGAITSVSNVDGTLTISPTTGDVVASLNLAHANTWTGKQVVQLTTQQFSVNYDASNRLDLTLGSTWLVTLDAVGSWSAFRFNDPVWFWVTPVAATALVDILGGYTTTGFPLQIKNAGFYNAYFQGTAANNQASFYIENDRGSFASYGWFVYGGSTSTIGNLFGVSRADKLFMFADWASNLGMYIGTLSAQPVVIGTNNVQKIQIASGWDVSVLVGNLKVSAVGSGLYVKEGTNATMGTATLVGWTVTVSTNKVTASSRIFLTVNGWTLTNIGSTYVSARTASTSFTISSTNVLDTSNVARFIVEPA